MESENKDRDVEYSLINQLIKCIFCSTMCQEVIQLLRSIKMNKLDQGPRTCLFMYTLYWERDILYLSMHYVSLVCFILNVHLFYSTCDDFLKHTCVCVSVCLFGWFSYCFFFFRSCCLLDVRMQQKKQENQKKNYPNNPGERPRWHKLGPCE